MMVVPMETVYDARSRGLTIGDRVTIVGRYDPGTITQITDSDADWDDYRNRYVGFPPMVSVDFDDGSDDSFPCDTDWASERWICADIERLTTI